MLLFIVLLGHNHMVDWWALGILIYEMISGGENPFKQDPDQPDRTTYENIMSHQKGNLPFPENFSASPAIVDLLNCLLDPNPDARMGSGGGFSELQNHPWFGDVLWDDIAVSDFDSAPPGPIAHIAQTKLKELMDGGVNLQLMEKNYGNGNDQSLFVRFDQF